MDLIQNILLAVFSLTAGSFLIMLAAFRSAQKVGRYRATHGKGWQWYHREWSPAYDRFANPILYAKVPVVNIVLATAGVSIAGWLLLRVALSFA